MNNEIAKDICSQVGGSFLDCKNIVWKWVNDEWIGKRSVWTKDNKAVWLEETTIDNIKTWWCGMGSNYNEVFK